MPLLQVLFRYVTAPSLSVPFAAPQRVSIPPRQAEELNLVWMLSQYRYPRWIVRFPSASKAKFIEGIEEVIRRIVESGGKVGNGVHRDCAK